ncbi:MAG: phytase [Chloroflexota bacterium]
MKTVDKRWLVPFLVFLCSFWIMQAFNWQNQAHASVTANVAPDFEVDGSGSDVDTIAFWETENANDVLMFTTAKASQLVEVWQFPFVGNEQTPLTHGTFGASGTRVNGVVVDQESDLLYVSVADPQSTVSVFSIPDLLFASEFISGTVNLKSEPNIDLLSHSNGELWAYVSADQTLYIYNAETGAAISQFQPDEGLETVLADDLHQIIYVPDEKDQTGVYAYQPDGTPFLNNGTHQFGQTNFDADAEGIILYHCPPVGVDNGTGFIIVADQIGSQSDFEFFDRQTWAHLGTLTMMGVANTDGIASTQMVLPGYPMGIFAAINDDSTTVGVGWDKVFTAMGIACGNDPAVPTNLSIATAVNDAITLTWEPHNPNNCNHEIYHDTSPYFDINDPTAVLLNTTHTHSELVTMMLGDTETNNYFHIRAINCDASSTAFSDRVGEFDFVIVAP